MQTDELFFFFFAFFFCFLNRKQIDTTKPQNFTSQTCTWCSCLPLANKAFVICCHSSPAPQDQTRPTGPLLAKPTAMDILCLSSAAAPIRQSHKVSGHFAGLCFLKKGIMTTECTTVLNSQLNIKHRQGHIIIPANTGKQPLYNRTSSYLHYLKFYFH